MTDELTAYAAGLGHRAELQDIALAALERLPPEQRRREMVLCVMYAEMHRQFAQPMRCVECGGELPGDQVLDACPHCGAATLLF